MTLRRTLVAAIAASAAFATSAASASAADYFVATTGTDVVNDCQTELNPCATITHAIDEHRVAPEADDVIEVAAGTYAQNFMTGDAADEGLTIRGELDGDGFPLTVVSGSGDGGGCGCVVNVAFGAAVTLENLEVSQDGTGIGENVEPVRISSSSTLTTVDVPQFRESALAGVSVDCFAPPGPVIEDSLIDTSGFGMEAIEFCNNLTLEDSTVISGSNSAIQQGAVGARLTVTRSFVGADPGNGDSVIDTSNFTLDSSVVAGGSDGVSLGGSNATADVNNSTVDADVPGDEDAGAASLVVDGGVTMDLDVDSSILLEEIVTEVGAGTVTCEYTNFLEFADDDGDYTNECPEAGAPGSTNTDLFPEQMFLGPDPFLPLGFDWSLQASSPAVDGGQPGPVPPGFSTTDFFEDPRIEPGKAASCPTGIRDQGAIEHAAVSCNATLAVAPTGNGSGTVTGPGINCGGGNTDCSETVARGSTIDLTATAAEGSSFGGFTGGGCSGSPCTVTLDGNRTVEARFTNTTPDQRTLTVQTTGSGTGTITGPGIDCGGEGHTDCAQAYPRGAEVALDATAGRNSVFDHFAGSGCGPNPCTVVMGSSRAVVGRFSASEGPTTKFAKRPRRATRRPSFKLESSQPESTFECKVDKDDWEECGKRVKLRGLRAGRHKLKARATNSRGVTGEPATARFRVSRRR